MKNISKDRDLEKAKFQIWQGVNLENQGRLDEAIVCYTQAVELDSRSIDALSILGVALKKKAQLQKNGEGVNKNNLVKKEELSLVRDNGNVSNLQVSQTVDRDYQNRDISMEKPNTALVVSDINSISKIEDEESEVAQLYLEQALAYFEAKQWDLTIGACKEALIIDPNLADAYKVWGNALQRLDRNPEALGCYAKALALKPNMPEVYANLGSLYGRQKKWSKAIKYYEKSLSINPNCAGVYRSLARIAEELENNSEALSYFMSALSLEPETLTVEQHYNLGNRLVAEQHLGLAIMAYKNAIELDPNFQDAYIQLAKVLKTNGQLNEASEYYQKLVLLQNGETISKKNSDSSKSILNLLKASTNNKIQPNKQVTTQKFKIDRRNINNINTVKKKSLVGSIEAKVEKKNNISNIQNQKKYLTELLQLGGTHVQKKEWNRAIECYEKALKLDPQYAVVYHNLAKVYQKIGDREKALEYSYNGCTFKPELVSASEHVQLGNALFQNKQIKQAISCYQRAIKLEPNLIEAYLCLGEVLESNSELESAINVYNAAIDRDKNNAKTYICLGKVLDKKHDREKAIACYRQAIKLEPNNWQVYQALGDSFSEQQQWSEAIAAYEKTIEIKSDFSWAYNNLGNVYFQTEQWTEAVTNFEKAIKLNSDFAWSRYNLGESLANLGEYESAYQAYKSAVELDPHLPQIYQKIANTLSKSERKNSPEALKFYQDAIEKKSTEDAVYLGAIELDSNNPEIYTKFGDTLVEQNRHDEAILAYNNALQNNPEDTELLVKLGNILIKQGQYEQAKEVYQKAATKYKEQGMLKEAATTHVRLGEILLKLDRLDEAIGVFQRSIQINPQLYQAYHSLGNAYAWQNKLDEAVSAYDRAISINPNYAWSYKGLGDVLSQQGKVAEVSIAYHKALQIDPQIFDDRDN